MAQSPSRMDLGQMEVRLSTQLPPQQRQILLHRLAARYTFTQVHRARELLVEQRQLLDDYPKEEYELAYHMLWGLVENQLYNYEAAVKSFRHGITLLEEHGSIKELIEAYIDYAGALMNLEQLDTASAILFKADSLLKRYPDDRLHIRLTIRKGFLHLKFDDPTAAIATFLEADRLASAQENLHDLKDQFFLTLLHSGLGKIYELDGDYEKSVQAYLRVVDRCQTMGIRSRLAWHYLNIGACYMALEQDQEAEQYFRRIIELEDDYSHDARASAFTNLADLAAIREETEQAFAWYDKAEDILHRHPQEKDERLSSINRMRGQIYRERKEYEQAAEALDIAYSIALEFEQENQLAQICQEMAALHDAQQEHEAAYQHLLLANDWRDRYQQRIYLANKESSNARYEAARRHRELERYRLEASRLQLKALRAQMNPHFLYNALNAIQHYITSHNTNAAVKYLAKFANLMRSSLENSELEIISLEEEVEFLRDYLFINEKLRFENQLTYKIVLDDDIEEDIMGVPTMIIQPYVENAIEHGLRSKQQGHVDVEFSLQDDYTIRCTVTDNGIGREQAARLKMANGQYQNHRSRGTRITERRLQLLNGSRPEDDQVYVRTFDLIDPDNGQPLGTRVEIMIPIVAL